jgi:signal transduction histidine kinase
MIAPTTGHPDSAIAVEDRLFRALAILRIIVTVNLVVLQAYRHGNYDHPTAGWVVTGALVVWTAVALWLYDQHSRRTPWLLVADLAIALGAIALTPVIKTPAFNATIPGFWVMGALLAWAIHWHWKGGLVAALLLAAFDLGLRDSIDQGNYGNVFLLVLGGAVVGYMCASLQEMAAQRDAAERARATAEERTRLARAVHDGVLQVLALVQRRGATERGEWARLGELAGAQERSLRSLIRQQDTVGERAAGVTDLSGALEELAAAHPGRVEVATPGTAVTLDASAATELLGAVSACLDNVLTHAGAAATAWVLLESTGGQVVVSVRDDGPGIPPGRLAEAEADGRLGVASSIRGRMAELGGTAVLDTGSWGTEWELAAPRNGQSPAPGQPPR